MGQLWRCTRYRSINHSGADHARSVRPVPRYQERKYITMEKQQLRSLIVANALTYAAEHGISNFKALCAVSADAYSFVKNYSSTTTAKNKFEYIDSILGFILGSDNSLTDTELGSLESYYRGSSCPIGFEYEITDEFKCAVSEYRKEIKRIIASTADTRRILLKAKICPALDRINDFVRYNELVQGFDKMLFFAEIYELGRIDGIRQERARHKNRL